jgi:hypothetical protein
MAYRLGFASRGHAIYCEVGCQLSVTIESGTRLEYLQVSCRRAGSQKSYGRTSHSACTHQNQMAEQRLWPEITESLPVRRRHWSPIGKPWQQKEMACGARRCPSAQGASSCRIGGVLIGVALLLVAFALVPGEARGEEGGMVYEGCIHRCLSELAAL